MNVLAALLHSMKVIGIQCGFLDPIDFHCMDEKQTKTSKPF